MMEHHIWRRFFCGLVIGLAVKGLNPLLILSPVLGLLETVAVAGFVSALLFGPAGWLGTTVAYSLVEASVGYLTSIPRLVLVLSSCLAGVVGFSIFRWVPNLGRGCSIPGGLHRAAERLGEVMQRLGIAGDLDDEIPF